MSWWECDRVTFQVEIATRYAVNRADPPTKAALMRLRAEHSTKAQASKGGKATRQQYRPQGRRKVEA